MTTGHLLDLSYLWFRNKNLITIHSPIKVNNHMIMELSWIAGHEEFGNAYCVVSYHTSYNPVTSIMLIIVSFLLGLKQIMSLSCIQDSKSSSYSSEYLLVLLLLSLIIIHLSALHSAIASRLFMPLVNVCQSNPLLNPSCLDDQHIEISFCFFFLLLWFSLQSFVGVGMRATPIAWTTFLCSLPTQWFLLLVLVVRLTSFLADVKSWCQRRMLWMWTPMLDATLQIAESDSTLRRIHHWCSNMPDLMLNFTTFCLAHFFACCSTLLPDLSDLGVPICNPQELKQKACLSTGYSQIHLDQSMLTWLLPVQQLADS